MSESYAGGSKRDTNYSSIKYYIFHCLLGKLFLCLDGNINWQIVGTNKDISEQMGNAFGIPVTNTNEELLSGLEAYRL